MYQMAAKSVPVRSRERAMTPLVSGNLAPHPNREGVHGDDAALVEGGVVNDPKSSLFC